MAAPPEPSIESERGASASIESERGASTSIESERGAPTSIESERGAPTSIESERGASTSIESERAQRPAPVSVSIGLKLWLTVTVVIAVASGILFVELGARERRHLVEAKVKASEMVADLLAASLAAPVDFEDQDAIQAELGHAKANPEVIWAGAYADGQGKLLASAGALAAPGSLPVGTVVGSDTVTVSRSIRSRSEKEKELGRSVLVLTLAPENAAFEEARAGILRICLLLALGTSTVLFLFTRTQLVAPLRRLAAAARDLERGRDRVQVDIHSRDELGALAAGFNRMSSAVVDREARLADAKREVVELLDNMRQAIVVFSGDGKIVGARSRAAAEVFDGRANDGALIRDVLYPGVAGWQVERRAFDEWLELFAVAPEASREDLVALAPPEVVLASGAGPDRVLELEWRPLAGDAPRVMLLATDVTDKRMLEATRDRQAREVAALRRFVGGGHVVAAFLESTEGRVARVRELFAEGEPTAGALEEAFQLVHTLRGEAHAYELMDVVAAASELEELFAAARREGGAALPTTKLTEGLLRISAGIDAARERFTALAPGGKAALESVPVPRRALEELRRAAVGRTDALGRAAERLTSRPFGELVSTVADRVPAWAEGRGKRARVEVDGAEVLVPEVLAQALPSVLLHLLRNAVAHGIEAPDARVEAGKSEVGLIRVRCVAREGSAPAVSIEDDGAGIEGPVEQIYEAGYTTEGSPTDLAGRGVGMGAVRRELSRVGFALRIATRRDRGASFEIVPAEPVRTA